MAAVLYHEGRFPPAALDWPRLIPLLGPAAAAVARYDGMLAAVPNPDVLLSPLTTQEAVPPSVSIVARWSGSTFSIDEGAEVSKPCRATTSSSRNRSFVG